MTGQDTESAKGHSYANDFANIYGSPDDKSGGDGAGHGAGSGAAGRSAHDTFDAIDTLNSGAGSAQLMHDPNATPDILLEQLAYVDNFIPSLDQDFVSIDSWVLGESQRGANDFGAHGNTMLDGNANGANAPGSFGLDEQLAVELSAFADEVFIFPDEDKPQNKDGEGDADDDTGDGVDGTAGQQTTESKDAMKKRHQMLSQRRNKFLTSQYDHSKARFAAGRSHRDNDASASSGLSNQDNDQQNGEFFDGGSGAATDHGGFTNFEVERETQDNTMPFSQPGQSPNAMMQRQHAPSISSPLSNLVAHQGLQQQRHSPQGTMLPQQGNEPQIHMPDYSQIPTTTLVALLPRVNVPPGAYQSLVKAGFTKEQIDAISAIIAYNEQNKKNPQRQMSTSSTEQQQDGRSSSDKGAHFLLDLLSNKKPGNTGVSPSAQMDGRRVLSPSADHQIPRTNMSPPSLTNFMSFNNPVKSEESTTIPFEQDLSGRHTSEPVLQKQEQKPSPVNRNGTSSLPPPTKKQKVTKTLTKPAPSIPSRVIDMSDDSGASSSQQSYSQKKKQKDKELENSINELNSLAMTLQQKIHTLEMENKLLKDLVVSSGEMDGIEQAESIKKKLLKKAHQSSANEEEDDHEQAKESDDDHPDRPDSQDST